jgi:hypothetical protein
MTNDTHTHTHTHTQQDSRPSFCPRYDWEFNTVEIYDYRKQGPFDFYFNYIRLNDKVFDGDIVESGVYRGKTLLGTALFLKEIGSTKKIYGFDSFSGFPPVYHKYDDISAFELLRTSNKISEQHYAAVKRNLQLKQKLSNVELNASSISKSSDFSNTSRAYIERKIELLGLDNIVLVEGPFSETMNSDALPNKIFCALFDCDLYKSYIDTFNFVWPRLNIGGLCQLDEYYSLKFPGGRIACDEFLKDKAHQLLSSDQNRFDEFERWAVLKLK